MKKIIRVLFCFLIYENYLFADGIDKAMIDQYLPSYPVIVEAGAHIGIDTVEMAQRWPTAKIYAFEPVPQLFAELKLRTKHFSNVICLSDALSSSSDRAIFYVSSGGSDGSSSLLQPQEHLTYHPTVLFNEVIEVSTLSLNDLSKKYAISHIDCLWLDMQGFELDMLKAVSDDLLETVKVIHIEVSLKELYKNCPLYPEVRLWLENKGFKVIVEDIRWADAGNVLFARI